jgi:hypothetical protein
MSYCRKMILTDLLGNDLDKYVNSLSQKMAVKLPHLCRNCSRIREAAGTLFLVIHSHLVLVVGLWKLFSD